MSSIERLESRVRSYSRIFPAVFARGVGCHLFDAQGRRYIDFFRGYPESFSWMANDLWHMEED